MAAVIWRPWPDLPACMSDGATPEEALKNVQDALALDRSAKDWKQDVPKPAAYGRAGSCTDELCEHLRADGHLRQGALRRTADLDGVNLLQLSMCSRRVS